MGWYEICISANQRDASPQSPKQKIVKYWVAPVGTDLKLNTYGAYLPNFPLGGTEGVLRDYLGRFQVRFAARYDFITSALRSELMAIQDGLMLATYMQLHSVMIESDCLQAVQVINSPT
ncbi:hypothetical protein ACLB2K_038471 [Fragaria x ananassa]